MKENSPTRQKLIDITYEEIYEKGYQGSSLSEILNKAGVNKGSMYYFFENKKELALTALREKISQRFINRYGEIAKLDENIIDELFIALNDLSIRDFNKGCPLANIIQEMSNLDKDFNDLSKKFYFNFRDIIKDILDKALLLDEIRECDTSKLALYITVVIEGAILASKATSNNQDYIDSIACLQEHINSYRVDKK